MAIGDVASCFPQRPLEEGNGAQTAKSVTSAWPAEHVINAEAGATGPLEPQVAQAVW